MAYSCSLGFSQHDSWVLRGSIPKASFPRKVRPVIIAFDVTQYNFYHILLVSSKPCVQPSTFKGREPHEGGKAGRPGSLALILGEQLPHTAKQGLALTAFFNWGGGRVVTAHRNVQCWITKNTEKPFHVIISIGFPMSIGVPIHSLKDQPQKVKVLSQIRTLGHFE